MVVDRAQISVNGRFFTVPAIEIDGRSIIVTGNWVKTAAIHDEEWQVEGIGDPEFFLAKIREEAIRADLFTFAQKLPDIKPRFTYTLELENLAVIPLITHKDWWEKLPQETRKNVRRAERRGVVVRRVNFDDTLVHGIKSIYDESPVRQGRRFWHYDKPLEVVKRENSSYLDRCDFIGAFYNEELIGFIKIVYAGKASSIMQIVSKNSHYDKRPANALLSKAVETCEEKGMACFVYGRYLYGKDNDTPLTEFKRRNGFEQVLIPRYYVPLTTKGKLFLEYNLHLGVRQLLPRRVEKSLLRLRSRLFKGRHLFHRIRGKSNAVGCQVK
jgi:FemAB family